MRKINELKKEISYIIRFAMRFNLNTSPLHQILLHSMQIYKMLVFNRHTVQWFMFMLIHKFSFPVKFEMYITKKQWLRWLALQDRRIVDVIQLNLQWSYVVLILCDNKAQILWTSLIMIDLTKYRGSLVSELQHDFSYWITKNWKIKSTN